MPKIILLTLKEQKDNQENAEKTLNTDRERPTVDFSIKLMGINRETNVRANTDHKISDLRLYVIKFLFEKLNTLKCR